MYKQQKWEEGERRRGHVHGLLAPLVNATDPGYHFINLEFELELELEIHISACILHFLKNTIYTSYAKNTLFLITLMTAIYLAASKRKKPTCGCL